jgi:hypothetical protein
MITTAALTLALLATFLLMGLSMAPITGRKAPIPTCRSGWDTDGNAWVEENHGGGRMRLLRNGRPWVDQGGTYTLATLTTRYGIAWER